MSFKSQFSASQEKAHNRNIATKIHEELSKLRAGVEASPTTPKRWVWELIQNAKVLLEGSLLELPIEPIVLRREKLRIVVPAAMATEGLSGFHLAVTDAPARSRAPLDMDPSLWASSRREPRVDVSPRRAVTLSALSLTVLLKVS